MTESLTNGFDAHEEAKHSTNKTETWRKVLMLINEAVLLNLTSLRCSFFQLHPRRNSHFYNIRIAQRRVNAINKISMLIIAGVIEKPEITGRCDIHSVRISTLRCQFIRASL